MNQMGNGASMEEAIAAMESYARSNGKWKAACAWEPMNLRSAKKPVTLARRVAGNPRHKQPAKRKSSIWNVLSNIFFVLAVASILCSAHKGALRYLRIIVCRVLLMSTALLVPALANAQITFDQFKKLPQKDRQQLITKTDDYQKQYKYWEQLLSSDNTWLTYQRQIWIINSKDLLPISSLYENQRKFWGYFALQMENIKHGSKVMTQEQKAMSSAVDERMILVQKQYSEDILSLVMVASSPEVFEVAKQASVLNKKLVSRFGEAENLTLEDLKAMDVEVAEIRDKVNRLPKWSTEQLQAAASAFPIMYEKPQNTFDQR